MLWLSMPVASMEGFFSRGVQVKEAQELPQHAYHVSFVSEALSGLTGCLSWQSEFFFTKLTQNLESVNCVLSTGVKYLQQLKN